MPTYFPFVQAILSEELTNRNRILKHLEQALRVHDVNLYTIACDPEFDFMHAEIRYQSVVKEQALSHQNNLSTPY